MLPDSTGLRVGGVPEHYNIPIHLAVEEKTFEKHGVEVRWTTCAGGTGEMTRALRNDDLDICIVLTEGIVADIVKGCPAKLVSGYTVSPLTWGIHTGADNALTSDDALFAPNNKIAISRFGSGSHLMPIVDANRQKQQIDDGQFKVIGNLQGALDSLTKLETDIFYWEKFTTKPYVDNGTLRRIGECVTPWPAFCVAATDKIIAEAPEKVIGFLRAVHEQVDKFMQDKTGAPQLASDRHNITLEDAQRWYFSTEWATHGWISNRVLESVLFHLKEAEILDQSVDTDATRPTLVWERKGKSGQGHVE